MAGCRRSSAQTVLLCARTAATSHTLSIAFLHRKKSALLERSVSPQKRRSNPKAGLPRVLARSRAKITCMARTKKTSIRQAFFRLGLHTKPRSIVHALAQQGIHVDEKLVRRVRFELLKIMTGSRVRKTSRPISQPMRRWPQRFGSDSRGQR
jgi:hypothetical protein